MKLSSHSRSFAVWSHIRNLKLASGTRRATAVAACLVPARYGVGYGFAYCLHLHPTGETAIVVSAIYVRTPKLARCSCQWSLARPCVPAKPQPFMLHALLVFCPILPSYLPYHNVCMKYTLCNCLVAPHIFLCSVYRLSWPANLVRGARTWDSFFDIVI